MKNLPLPVILKTHNHFVIMRLESSQTDEKYIDHNNWVFCWHNGYY